MAKICTLIVLILFLTGSNILSARQSTDGIARGEKKHTSDTLSGKKGFYGSAEWMGEYGGTRNYVDHTHFGIHFKGNLLNRNAVHINLGYLLSPHIYIGGGTGVEYQDRGFGDYTGQSGLTLYVGALWVVPVYGEVRGYLLAKPTSPFLQLRVGYAPSIYAADKLYKVYNSSFDNFSIGMKIHNRLSVTLGYLFMYQPNFLTGYNHSNNSPIIDRTHPFEHYCTVGVVANFK